MMMKKMPFSSVSTFSVCLLACVRTCLSEDPQTLTPKTGDDVTLPCRGPRDGVIELIRWNRPDLKSEGYVFFYRDERSYENYQLPSYRGRVELTDPQMKDGDISVVLKNVTINDAGGYECRVGIGGNEPELINSIILKVKDSVSVNITAEPGQTVSLSCRAPTHTNIIVVEWNRPDLEPGYVFLYRDQQPDPDDQHPSFKNRVELKDRDMKDGDVSVILKNVTRDDAGRYECRTGSSEPISIIYLDVQTAEPGQTVSLSCRAPTHTNFIVVEWNRPDLDPEHVFVYRDQQPVPDEQNPSFKNRVELEDRDMKDGNVSVILKNVTRNDAGTYECRVIGTGSRRKRAAYNEPICIIYLNVQTGPTAGPREEGGDKNPCVGLGVGLSAALLVVAGVGFLIYRR